MAICKICGGEMLNYVGCKVGIIKYKGKEYPRVKFGEETGPYALFGEGDHCCDCYAPFGSFHHYGCDREECPICGEIIYGACDCDFVVPDLEECSGREPGLSDEK
ncbi:hypothetical protein [[Clostridium] symbiosum]|uniref:hypothetical protein n=1 Tax=Clostridium symbiosum TaxID=1512 RepID=UPI001AA107DB|nr:hypothetical protein [[Clostridium] symbiosum]MBO1695244.1 hypothetical protein [[Clostridium] symbiosum]